MTIYVYSRIRKIWYGIWSRWTNQHSYV